jgi:hypothetical protein
MNRGLLCSLALLAGCGDSGPKNDALLRSDALVPIYREDGEAEARRAALSTSAVPAGTADEKSFYLALNKNELGKKWFLSGYMKQFFPGAEKFGAAQALATRVVTFRVQNGKLFVFDAADDKKTSDVFDPTVILEAYPIVTDLASFLGLPGSGNYVLFDPAAGLNRFGVVSDAFGSSYPIGQNLFDDGSQPPDRFQVELAYSQRFRSISDGFTYEQVFTGYREHINDGLQPLKPDDNLFRASGTLGIALRRYSEGAGFVASPPPGRFYFDAESRIVPNEGRLERRVAKWNIKPGMKPIKWLISDRVNALAADPRYAGIDILDAIKQGIEGWNQVFGFKVLEAVVAPAGTSFADDDVNYFIIDKDPSVGFAYANWRTNPNTGEIRGASIYFNEGFIVPYLQDDPPAATAPTAHARLVWQGASARPLCVHPGPKKGTRFTGKEKAKLYLQGVVLHEVGHTLGLKHNFKGSLVPPSSSVMDYLDLPDQLLTVTPGSYDTEALKLLYGQQTTQPKDPYCDDYDSYFDPDCVQFDFGQNPLDELFGPYQLQDYLLTYVRAGATVEVQLNAWSWLTYALDDLKAQQIFTKLFITPADPYGTMNSGPPRDPGMVTVAVGELRASLLNAHHDRGFPTRRIAVDALKGLQSLEAYDVLLEAQAAVAAERQSATGSNLALVNDLGERIEKALSPYFTK